MPPQNIEGHLFLFMKLIFHQAQISGDTRTEYLDGREYLVAPAVIIVEGVLNGSYVPATEIEISTYSWNGRPIPVHHPPIANSANEPAIIESRVIGSFFAATYQNNGLTGEMWFDVAKANKLGGDAVVTIEAVANGDMVELSTAYWCWQLNQAGEFNGKKYETITTHILPDHVAVLPGDVGACSINDGCGVNRLNREEEQSMNKVKFKKNCGEIVELDLLEVSNERETHFHLTENVEGLSHGDIRKALRTAVNHVTSIATDFYVWVEDVWDTYFVYEIEANGNNASGYWQRDYTIDAEMNVTLGSEIRVQPRRIFEPVKEQPQTQQTNTWNQIKQFVNNLFDKHAKEMDMKDMIDAIVTNGTTGLTAEQLGEFSNEAVTAVYNGLHLNDDEGEEEPETVADVEPTASEDVPAWAASLVADVKGLASKVDGLTSTANQQQERERANIVAELSRNSQCPFDESDLKEFDLKQLKKLQVKFIEPDYSGLMVGNGADNYDGYEYAGLAINAAAVEVK